MYIGGGGGQFYNFLTILNKKTVFVNDIYIGVLNRLYFYQILRHGER